MRSDLGNLLKALGRLDEAKVWNINNLTEKMGKIKFFTSFNYLNNEDNLKNVRIRRIKRFLLRSLIFTLKDCSNAYEMKLLSIQVNKDILYIQDHGSDLSN